jgi:hypothetical protein
MPWVVDMGLVCLGEPVCGIGVLCVIKTLEVVGLWSKSQERVWLHFGRGLCRGWWMFGRGFG